jgi:hypothetical protein
MEKFMISGGCEKLGCERVYETIVENKEYRKLGSVLTKKAFIYTKKLWQRK